MELVKAHNSKDLAWLDVGCGTGKMGSVAFELCKHSSVIWTEEKLWKS